MVSFTQIFLVGLLSSGLQTSPPPAPQAADTAVDTLHILVDSVLIDSLDQIADTATVEHFRCLVGGYLPPDTVVVTKLVAPKENNASLFHVTAELCPPHTVGAWHIHLPVAVRILNDSTSEVVPIPTAAACYFSYGDVQEAGHHPELSFYMVHVRRGIYGWWTTRQIYILSHGWQPINIPCLPKQRSYS